jgi:hypothetical protein
MKKLLITWTIITSLILSGCGNNSNEWEATWWSTFSSHNENYKVKLYTCTSKNLKWWCSQVEKETIWVFKVNPKLCDLTSITDKDEINLDDIVENPENTKLLKFQVDPKTKLVNLIISKKKINTNTTNENPKNIDILFDLTYYSINNKDIENEIITTRKKKLTEELQEDLKPGDKITLRYIWTIDYGKYPEHKNEVLKDIDEFKLKWANSQKIETKYYSLTLRCKSFKRTKTLKIYTHLENKKKERFSNKTDIENIPIYETKEQLINAVLSKIDNKYNSGKYSYWTYLLETLSNYEDFLNRKDYTKNDINLIISDFRFQLHPIMKKRKNIPEDTDFSFPPKKLSLWKKGTIYYDFYTKTIPSYFEDRCPHHEKLNLIGLETDDIEIKKIMKDYYKNYLFKKCNVEFK